jgi:hypothetical protein
MGLGSQDNAVMVDVLGAMPRTNRKKRKKVKALPRPKKSVMTSKNRSKKKSPPRRR